jgi:hypothetical protein
MSVLQLRRDMVVGETPASVDTALVTIDAPFPLRTINVTPDAIDTIDVEDEAPRKSFGQHARGWLRLIALLAVLGAYPTMVVMASNVGDRKLAGLVDRAQWTAPWAGGAAALIQRHTMDLGWASDAADWTPMARLSAKPALQHALAESLGDYITLMSEGAAAAGHPDSDLSAAARLVNASSTGVQMHAARDALVNFDRRERRRGAVDDATPAKLGAQLQLVDTWGARSQGEIANVSSMTNGGLIERSATEAVYKAKGRAQAAYVFIETMHWPEDAKSVAARNAALAAWKTAAEFHPMLVLNGSPDGSVLGNHAASMGFLIAQARKATTDYLAAIQAAPAAAPVAIANAAAATLP